MANKIGFLIELQDRFSGAAKKVQKRIKGLGASANSAALIVRNKLSKSFTDFRKNLKTKVLIGLAVATLAFKKMVSVGASFQTSLADLSAITGLAGKDLGKLSDDMLKLGKGAITSGDDVAIAFKLIASAKPELLENIPALKSMTKEVLLLKNAAGIELAEAADIATKGLNIFGLGADQVSRVVNVLAAGAKFGSSEIRDTGEAMKIAGPQAVAAGLSFEQLNAAIQATAKGGIKGTQAGTALGAIFGRLRRTGLDIQKLGLPKTFELVKDVLDKTTDSTKKAQLEAKIFGEEHAKVGLALLGNIGFLKKVERQIRGTNVAQEQANIRLNTFNKRAEKLGIVIKEKMIKVFNRLEPVLTRQVEALEKWFEALSEEDIQNFSDALEGMLTIINALGKAIAVVSKGFNAFGKAFGAQLASEVELFTEIFAGTKFANDAKRKQIRDNQIRVNQRLKEIQIIKKQRAEEEELARALDGVKGTVVPIDIANITKLESALANLSETELSGKAISELKKIPGAPGQVGVTESLNRAASATSRSSIEGEIVVRATAGTMVESTKLKTRSNGLNMGLNVVTGGG